MIKEKELLVLITRRNITYYKNLGYIIDKINKEVLIKIEDVNKNSHIKITAICNICGEESILPLFKYYENFNRQNYYGCKKCSILKRINTNIELYGIDNYSKTQECKDLVANNNYIKYGVKTTLLEKNTLEKINTENLRKYNTTKVLSNKSIREKSTKTIYNKFGVYHYSKTKEFYESTYNTWKKYIIKKLQDYNITDYILKDDRTIDIKCDLGKDHYYNITSKNLYQRKQIQHNILCTVCNPINNHSSGKELEILDFIINNYNGIVIHNDIKILNGKELDIYLPELNLAFEFNGLYWHCEKYKDKYYHKNKTDKCLEQDIILIHIWEDDWCYKKDIVKTIILNHIKK